jgi:hypothetical protein
MAVFETKNLDGNSIPLPFRRWNILVYLIEAGAKYLIPNATRHITIKLN